MPNGLFLRRCLSLQPRRSISISHLLKPAGVRLVSVAFTKEESAETAAESVLPDRPIPPGPNLVTASGLAALKAQVEAARAAYDAAQTVDDINERRRQSAVPLRDFRYFSERLRTAQPVPPATSTETVTFGSTVTFSREDGRVQSYRIVGEDEAEPKSGTISHLSPIAQLLLGKSEGDVATLGDQEIEILKIA
jgi:transcription elongation GreA/GreB family factor